MIRLYNDIVFKWIFGRQEYTSALLNLLNAVLKHGGDVPFFNEVQILNPFDPKKPLSLEKLGILDIKAKETQSNIWVDIEIQVAYKSHYILRALYYLAGLYRDQLKSGESYSELRPCYGIHLLIDDILMDETNQTRWFNHYGFMNYETYAPLNRYMELYFLELGKFDRLIKDKSLQLDDLEQWAKYLFKERDLSEPLEKYNISNDVIKEVDIMLQAFTANDHLREQYRVQEEWLRVQSTEAYVKEQLEIKYAQEQRLRKEEQRRRKEEQRRREDEQRRREEEQRRREQAELLHEDEQRRREEIEQKHEALIKRIESLMKKKGFSDIDVLSLQND